MPKKAAKKRTTTKSLPAKKKKMSAKDMKKVKGGNYASINFAKEDIGLLLPAVQKVREG